MAVLIKILGQRLDAFQIVFFRCIVGLAVMTPLMLRTGLHNLRTPVPYLHLGRAVAGVTAMMCGFYAFTHLPLAAATAVTFTKPLFMIVLAVLFQGLRVVQVIVAAEALGVDLPVVYFFIIYPMVILIALMPISIGGLGVREAAFVVMFGWVGMTAEQAFATSILVYLATITAVLPGGWLFVRSGVAGRLTAGKAPDARQPS